MYISKILLKSVGYIFCLADSASFINEIKHDMSFYIFHVFQLVKFFNF